MLLSILFIVSNLIYWLETQNKTKYKFPNFVLKYHCVDQAKYFFCIAYKTIMIEFLLYVNYKETISNPLKNKPIQKKQEYLISTETVSC